MLTESLLILLIIGLSCGLVYLLQDVWPFSIAYATAAPLMSQMQGLVTDLLAGPLGLWNDAQTQVPWIDDAVKMGGTSALTASILKYVGNKAKTKLETSLKEKTTELKNHTSEIITLNTENTTLTTQRDQALDLAGQLPKLYEGKLQKLQDDFDTYKETTDEQTQKLIQERNAALSIDKTKIVDEIKEATRKH